MLKLKYREKETANLFPRTRAIAFLLGVALSLSNCRKQDVSAESEMSNSSNKGTHSTTAVADFSIVVMPDTQHYMAGYFGGTYAMFTSQIDWIKNNKTAQNIVYVIGVGDVVEHGDDPAYASNEWPEAATNGYYRLESSSIPYGLAVGNHDQYPVNTSILTATTNKFNQYFGRSHFSGRTYYGGNLAGSASNNNDSHYDLFSASGIDFIVIYLEYDHANEQSATLNDWAYNLCTTYASRKAIIVTHYAIREGDPGPFGTQGFRTWDRLKNLSNVFMILGGHVSGVDDVGEGYREDVYNGKTIRTYLSDYQQRTGGGNGLLRIMKFSIDNDEVRVKTYSPYTGAYETDINSQFTKPMFGGPPVAHIPDGKYKIIAQHSGKALVVYNASLSNGADIVQWTYGGGYANDEWNFAQIGTSGYYTVTNVHSGKALAIIDASTAEGAKAIQWDYGPGYANDEWAIFPLAGGYYKLVARHSGLSLNVAGSSTADGAAVKQYYSGAGTNDNFQMVAIP